MGPRIIESTYGRLPLVLQDAAVSIQGARVLHRRHGPRFESATRGYFERDSWSEERILEFRDTRRALALEQASHAPYYRELFDSMHACWQDFLDESAWRLLPILTKENLTQGIDRFRPRRGRRDDIEVRASGTTGASLSMPKSANVDAEQWAVWWRYWGWHGIQRGDCCGLFSSTPIVFSNKGPSRPWRLNLAGREIRFSIFHISDTTVPDFLEVLERFKPEWIHGNPSAVALFASLASIFHEVSDIHA